ncbi:MAG TPA: type II toxin-antitoxin system RelE/ParE family toxin [Allosphingosinicella sp.]|nr:type II toxin-antitoxin system RelE/ParE family toxin [Allosphingosinicella sp.]
MKVRFNASAEADLEAIGDWIAEDDPGRAASFVVELRERCLSLTDKPNRFPVARRTGGHVFRKLVHRDYLIFYRVLADRVDIVHVLHGARDWTGLLGAGK